VVQIFRPAIWDKGRRVEVGADFAWVNRVLEERRTDVDGGDAIEVVAGGLTRLLRGGESGCATQGNAIARRWGRG